MKSVEKDPGRDRDIGGTKRIVDVTPVIETETVRDGGERGDTVTTPARRVRTREAGGEVGRVTPTARTVEEADRRNPIRS